MPAPNKEVPWERTPDSAEKGKENPYSCVVLAGQRSMDERRHALRAFKDTANAHAARLQSHRRLHHIPLSGPHRCSLQFDWHNSFTIRSQYTMLCHSCTSGSSASHSCCGCTLFLACCIGADPKLNDAARDVMRIRELVLGQAPDLA